MVTEEIKLNENTESKQDEIIKDVRQITNNEAIKSMDEIRPWTRVYANLEPGFIKEALDYSAEIKTDSWLTLTTKDFFLDTEHVKLVSEIVGKKREKLTKLNLPININVYHMFEEHRIKMCKNEKNPEEYEKAKEKFNQFIKEYENAIETLNSLSVWWKPLLKK